MNLETIKLKIRKNKDIIYTNGYGVLVFILWHLIKAILYSVDAVPEIDPEVATELDIVFSSLFSSVLIALTILTIVTGLMAIRVGKKNSRHHIALIVLSTITCLLSLQLMIDDIYLCATIANYSISIISVITDVFFFVMTLILTISSFKLNRLRKLEKGATTNER